MEDKQYELVEDIYEIRRKLVKEMPDSRERSLGITKLDEAAFWIKSIPVSLD